MRHHLYRGVLKGALTQEQADAKLAKWLEDKSAKIEGKKGNLSDAERNAETKRIEAEKAASEARAAKIAAKNAPAPVAEATPEVEAPATENTENAPAENTENA